ncbi:hypothetical protein Hanom_Chr09g00819041 [Helianthus anomalus]
MFCELGNKKATCSRSQWIKPQSFRQSYLPEEQSNHRFSPHPKPDALELSIPSFQTSGYV